MTPISGLFRGLTCGRFAALAIVAVALIVGGCGSDDVEFAGPLPADLTTPRALLRAMEEFYSDRQAPDAVSLLADSYRFIPLDPEAIHFLTEGETSWDRAREVAILEVILDPVQLSWLDQVLLETSVRSVTANPQTGLTEVEAVTELDYTTNESTLLSSKSTIVFSMALRDNGDYEIVEAREVEGSGSEFEPTVGEQKATAVERAP